jgi:hypothetical protein
MTPQQIVGVAVRLFAIWLVFTAIQAAGTGMGTSAQPGAQSTVAPYVFSALFLVVAIVLWVFPMIVAHKLVPRTKFDNILLVPTHEALVVACVILGLWVLVVRAVPAIAYYATVAIYWSRNGQSFSSLDPSLHFGFVLALVQFVMALFLIFKARGISAFIFLKHRDRSEG